MAVTPLASVGSADPTGLDVFSAGEVQAVGGEVLSLLAEAERLQVAAVAKLAVIDRAGLAALWGYVSTERLVAHRARVSNRTAGVLVSVARHTDRHRATGEALVDGRVSLGQVEVLAAAARGLDDVYAGVEEQFVDACGDRDVDAVGRLARGWRAVSDRRATAEDAEHTFESRGVWMQQGFDGSCKGSFRLDPVAAETVWEALDTSPDPVSLPHPARTGAQRRADALAEVCHYYLNPDDPDPDPDGDPDPDRERDRGPNPGCGSGGRPGDDFDCTDRVDGDGDGDGGDGGSGGDGGWTGLGGGDGSGRCTGPSGSDGDGDGGPGGDGGSGGWTGLGGGGGGDRAEEVRTGRLIERRRVRRRRRVTADVVIDIETLAGACPQEISRLRSELASGAAIHGPALDRLLCDASFRALITDGARQVLAYNRATPLIPPALRRVVIARDRHCQFAGCDRPHSWCDLHHLTPRQQGGPTTVENLALLCRFHHGLVHDGGWQLTRAPNGSITTTSP